MKAERLFYRKILDDDGYITEMVIWKLPKITKERPQGIKYRLYYGDPTGRCLVRYDNERGKGDHKHIRGDEVAYEFDTVETLIQDFMSDIDIIRSGG